MIRPPSTLWPPSSQISLPGGAKAKSFRLLSRCMRAGQSALTTPCSKARGGSLEPADAQRRNGGARIVELVPAKQPRRRQIEQARFVLIDQPPTFLADDPFLAHDVQRRADFFGAGAR